MIEVKTKLRKWGNSFGLVVPVKFVQSGELKEGEEVTLTISSKNRVDLRKIFGIHKFKKSTEEMMKEMDKELYNE